MNTKAFIQSKTVWVQIITFISTFVPAVGEWLGSNGVTILQVLTALNVLVRFFTHGKISSLFKDDNKIPLMVVTLGMALASGGLVSCSLGALSSFGSADRYIVNTVPYAEQIKSNPDAVIVAPEDVEEVGGFSMSGGVKLLTDDGEFELNEDGLSGQLVVDQRSGK